MNGLVQDVRYALRQSRKNPGFTAIAVITLALGIAVNATMFSLISAFLLTRPAVSEPKRIAVVSSINPSQVYQADAFPVSPPNYLAWRNANHVFADVAAADESRTINLAGIGQPEVLRSAAVSPNYFEVLGVSPELGRSFSAGEDQPGRDRVVILSYDFWQRRFGSDPSILGRTMRLNRENYLVIGVMPPNFRLIGFVPEVWTPMVLSAKDQTAAARQDRSLHLFARLKPEVTIEQARSELSTLASRAQHDFPDSEKGWGATVRTLPDFLIYNFGICTGLLVMMTTVGFVLMIACANVAGMLLARALGRQKEISIRVSLGASRARIVSQLLSEGLILAVLGGGIGLLVSYWGINFVRANLLFNAVISAVPVSLNWNVACFVAAVSLLSALLCSLAPAVKVSRTDVNTNLKDETRTVSSGRSQSRLRNILVSGEIALALFLLIGTGLLIHGIFLLEHQNLGFQADHLLTAGVTLDSARYRDASQQSIFVRDLIFGLQHLPGVNDAAVTSDLPATGPASFPVRIKGQPDLPSSEQLSALDVVVTADYFRTTGTPVLQGRTFTEMDNASAPRVIIVNQEFVHRFLQDREPLGKEIRLDVSGGTGDWSQIIGVVGNVKTYSEETRDDPEVYEAFSQRPIPSFSLMLRTNSDPTGLASALHDTVARIDADLPLARVMSMPALIEQQRNGNPFFMRVFGCFALLALILASVGIYALIAYSAGRRTHEIGIRMALGARRLDVLRMMLGEGLKMTATGAAIGLLMSLPLPRIFDSLFFGLHFSEPRLYLLVPAAILLVTTFATYIPARLAAKVEPMIALRYE